MASAKILYTCSRKLPLNLLAQQPWQNLALCRATEWAVDPQPQHKQSVSVFFKAFWQWACYWCKTCTTPKSSCLWGNIHWGIQYYCENWLWKQAFFPISKVALLLSLWDGSLDCDLYFSPIKYLWSVTSSTWGTEKLSEQRKA